MNFLSEDVHCIYKSTILTCMEYCSNIGARAFDCFVGTLNKLQKWLYRVAGPTVAVFLEPLAHRRNVFIFNFFCRY